MSFQPVRARALPNGDALVVADSGCFAAVAPPLLARLLGDCLTTDDDQSFRRTGLSIPEGDSLAKAAHAYGVAERLTQAGELDYLILVPTLRCNLSCSYCQVSRAGLRQPGYDWDEATLAAVLRRIDSVRSPRIKIEFQGGEPTLRPDLLNAVIAACERFESREFVVCTNLQEIGPEILAIFDRPDVYVSTSLDGDAATHSRNRTGGAAATEGFLANLRFAIDRYGPGKVSALPTVDPRRPPEPDDLINSYSSLGLNSIFLRPINFQGFARKRHAESREQGQAWRQYYERFVRRLIERNWEDRSRFLEETYFGICLRRIFQPGHDRHVDLRNPNPMGTDYVVIDFDGKVYPTDEARMLSRSGVIDLSIGNVAEGWEGEARAALNAHATNQFDPACRRCAYQPFCGRDVIDDIARYGRIDVPRTQTEFCRRHLHLFDFIFALVFEDDAGVRYSLSRWLRLPGTPTALAEQLA